MIHCQCNLQSIFESNGKGFHTDANHLLVSVVIVVDDAHAKESMWLFLLMPLDLNTGIFPGQRSGFFLLQ